MERLFPEKRSAVPVDEGRKQSVFDILLSVGVITTTEVFEDAVPSEDQSEEGYDRFQGEGDPEVPQEGEPEGTPDEDNKAEAGHVIRRGDAAGPDA